MEQQIDIEVYFWEQAGTYGMGTEMLSIFCADPMYEINKLILKTAGDYGPGLSVVTSHPPRMSDRKLASHNGHIAGMQGFQSSSSADLENTLIQDSLSAPKKRRI